MTTALGAIIAPALVSPALAHDQQHQIAIRNFIFEPADLIVQPGDHIVFTNHDLTPHTATADDLSWDTGPLERGESIDLTVTKEWTESYYCAFHPSMISKLIINTD